VDSANEAKKQGIVENIFTKCASASAVSSKSKADEKSILARQIAVFCALDHMPFSITESKGFQLFCKWNNINNLPTRKTISDHALTDIYVFCMKQIKEILSTAPKNISLVLDCSSDNHRHNSYINYRVHFCDKNFRLKLVTLKTEFFPRPHTMGRMKKSILDTLAEFNLQDKKIIAVTDSGSDVVAGCRLAGLKRFGCSCHALHLLVAYDILKKNQFQPINVLMLKLKTIYRAMTFKHAELTRISKDKNMINFVDLLEKVTVIGKFSDVKLFMILFKTLITFSF
jgi:hypothetical protein